jgi:hypothetical protein
MNVVAEDVLPVTGRKLIWRGYTKLQDNESKAMVAWYMTYQFQGRFIREMGEMNVPCGH